MNSLEASKPENQNATWIESRGAWVMYVLILATVRFMMYSVGMKSETAWTSWNVSHAVVRDKERKERDQ